MTMLTQCVSIVAITSLSQHVATNNTHHKTTHTDHSEYKYKSTLKDHGVVVVGMKECPTVHRFPVSRDCEEHFLSHFGSPCAPPTVFRVISNKISHHQQIHEEGPISEFSR